MKPFLLINKPQGLTPFQVITKLKAMNAELTHETIGYAGRLDPMADGLLLLLLGEENKKRKTYEDLEKTYETDILIGVSTDTYDLLGKVASTLNAYNPVDPDLISDPIQKHIQDILPSFLGQQTQPYPPFSSQPVNGKPLFYWARENKLDEITIPTKNVTIHSIELLSMKTIETDELHYLIQHRISKVDGNFRQEEILALWNEFFTATKQKKFQVVKLRVTCTSGTYIRSLAHSLGEKLGIGALAMTITRTHVGDFSLADAQTI